MDNSLELLLEMEIPQPETADYKVKRLSKLCGRDVVFRIRELSYNRVQELRRVETDSDVHILLAGVVEPDLKEEALQAKFGAPTPAELVKKMLRPGEIEDLKRAIERLSGYRVDTLEEVKKN